MIVNFRYTKWFLIRFLFAVSVIGNIYAILALETVEKCDTTAIEEQIDMAQTQYEIWFGDMNND